MSKISPEYLAAIGILIAGVILRLWAASDIPLTYDEYSSIFRASQDSIADVINLGIRTDAHPALHHVFQHYYLKIAGISPLAIKLPYLVCGCISVWLTFIVGKRYFNVSVGLVAMAFLSVLQFSVMHSQIARPYAPALMLVLLVFYNLGAFSSGDVKWKSVFGLTLSLALAAYTHHIAALVAVVSFVAGVLIVDRAHLKKYVLAGVVAVVLYIPHISITIDQLGMKGIATVLPDAELMFFGNHIQYIFNFSIPLIGIASMIFIWTLFRLRSFGFRHWLFFFVVWIMSWAVIFLYSKNVGSILQDRILLFSLPALLLAISAGLFKASFSRAAIVSLGILIIGGSSLIFGRDHYHQFYNSSFEGVISKASEYSKDDLKILSYHPPIYDYQAKKLKSEPSNVLIPDSSWTISTYKNAISNSPGDTICFGWTTQYYLPPLEVFPIALEYYPSLHKYRSFSHGEVFSFSRTGSAFQPDTVHSFNPNDALWQSSMDVRTDSLGNESHQAKPDQEFFLKFEAPIEDLYAGSRSRIYGSFYIKSGPGCEALAVAECKSGGNIEHRKDISFSLFQEGDSAFCVHIGISLYDVKKRSEIDSIAFYLWNRNRESFEILDARIWSESLNKNIYAVDQRFEP